MGEGKIYVEKIKDIPQEKLFEKAYQLGLYYERKAHCCAQGTVGALEELFGIEDENLFKASYSLCGGLGSTTKGTCGALSGGAMIIGYIYGRDRKEFDENISNRKASYLSKLLYERFIQEYGSCLCKDVQLKLFGRTFDFWNDEDRIVFDREGGHDDKCPVVVAKVCVWAVEIIRENYDFSLPQEAKE